ncbi:hypothetical protein [Bacillus sp. AK031]
MAKKKDGDAWADAKKRCRMNEADIRMAKALGMKPKSLIKNIPLPKQQWKMPVKEWVRELYEKKFGKVLQPERASGKAAARPRTPIYEEDLPF